MVVCDGRGDNGDHCCYINGQVCEFLTEGEGTARCSMWNKMNTGKWRSSPVGLWMAVRYPGFTCRDWPQNIPEVLAEVESGRVSPAAVCCWSVNYGDA